MTGRKWWRTKTWKALLAALLVAATLLPVVYAGVFSVKNLNGTVMIQPTPLIWYEDPGTSGVAVSLTPDKQYADVSINIDNHALHIYDYNTSAGIVVCRSFASYAGDYSGSLQRFSIEWDVLGVEMLEDPSSDGLVLGEITIVAAGEEYYFSFYYYEGGQVTPEYWLAGTSGSCSPLEVNPWRAHSINITAVAGGSEVNVYWYFDGNVVCSLTVAIDPNSVTIVSTQIGRYNYTNTYSMYVDNVRIALDTSDVHVAFYDDFEDGVDNIFGLDTYYTSPQGSSPSPPPDNSVGKYVEPVFAGTILDVDTSLASGTSVASWMNLTIASCTAGYTEYTVPVVVQERSGNNLVNYSVRIELNSTNFQDWNVLSSDGSDIYFTNASGNPLYYWIESIDVDNRHAVIWVKLPSLPAHSEATIYMHYGGSNPYTSYNDPDNVFLFYDDFNYNSINELLASGKWVGVEVNYVNDVNNSILYIDNGDNVFALRTIESFTPPFVVEFSLAACRNVSSDWDSGVAIGWDNETYYVAFLDDIGGARRYVGNYLAIAEGLDARRWTNNDYIDTPRLDRNWLIPHIYAVYVSSDGDKFVDKTDGRTNVDDYYDNRAIVSNYGGISGYLWLVNDGDTGDNCAAYDWVRVRRYVPGGAEPVAYVLPRATPIAVEYFSDADSNVWTDSPLWVEKYTVVVNDYTGIVNLEANGSIINGNLSHIGVFAAMQPGTGTVCTLDVEDPYGLIPGEPGAAVLTLQHRVRISVDSS